MGVEKKPITITQVVLDRYRAIVYGTASTAPVHTGDWRESYEAAQDDLCNTLANKGINFYGEIDKVYMTESTYNKIVDDAEAKAATLKARING